MPFGGLQDELDQVLGHKLMPYWKAYLLGIPTLFIYPLIWMSRIVLFLLKIKTRTAVQRANDARICFRNLSAMGVKL